MTKIKPIPRSEREKLQLRKLRRPDLWEEETKNQIYSDYIEGATPSRLARVYNTTHDYINAVVSTVLNEKAEQIKNQSIGHLEYEDDSDNEGPGKGSVVANGTLAPPPPTPGKSSEATDEKKRKKKKKEKKEKKAEKKRKKRLRKKRRESAKERIQRTGVKTITVRLDPDTHSRLKLEAYKYQTSLQKLCFHKLTSKVVDAKKIPKTTALSTVNEKPIS